MPELKLEEVGFEVKKIETKTPDLFEFPSEEEFITVGGVMEKTETVVDTPPKVRHLIASILATIDIIGQQFYEDLGGYLIGRPIPGGGLILFIPEEVVHEIGYLPYSPETEEELKEALNNLINSKWFIGWASSFLGIDLTIPENREKYRPILERMARKIYSDIL